MFVEHGAQSWIASRGIDRNPRSSRALGFGTMIEEQLWQQPHVCAAARCSSRPGCETARRKRVNLVPRVGIGAAHKKRDDGDVSCSNRLMEGRYIDPVAGIRISSVVQKGGRPSRRLRLVGLGTCR